MQVLLLGPIALRGPCGTPVEIGGPKRRAVLAALALEINRPVSVDRLLDLVWDGDPPARARAALHGHVAGLRKVLPAGFGLDTLPSGYRLTGDPALVDSRHFEELWRRARSADDQEERSTLLQQALGLWRGDAVADLPDGVFRLSVVGRLHETRTAALEAWADCELRRGQGGRVVPTLEAAVQAEGLRETLVGALMRCLVQAGRPAEALAAFHHAASALRAELGGRPGPELQRALGEVLSGESGRPDPTGDASADGMLPSPPQTPLIGRSEERAWLDRATRPGTGEVPLAVLVGPAGVGKTALVADWARAVADRFPDGRFFADLGGSDEQDPEERQEIPLALLLALGGHRDEIPAAPAERAELFARLTDGRRILLILDNVHAAEDVRPLLPSGEGSAVVATSRSALLDLIAHDGAAWRLLRPLQVEEAVELLAAAAGAERVAADPQAARRLAVICDQLPSVLHSCASRLAGRPHRTLARLLVEIEEGGTGLDGLDPSGDIRASLSLTYRHLPSESALLLALLDLLPYQEIAPASAAALLGCGVPEARTALGILASYHLLSEDRPGRYTRSGLIRRYSRHLLAETVAAEQRHAAVGRLIDLLPATTAEPPPGRAPFWGVCPA